MMPGKKMRSHLQARPHAGIAFFDRGIPDAMGRLRPSGMDGNAHVTRAPVTFGNGRRGLVAPSWRLASTRGGVRWQDLEEGA
jgi:predicted ATPase